MEIGPIAGGRTVSLQRPSQPEVIQQTGLSIDASERLDDDTYSHDEQAEGGGLEDGCAEAAEDEENVGCDPAEPTTPAVKGTTISILA